MPTLVETFRAFSHSVASRVQELFASLSRMGSDLDEDQNDPRDFEWIELYKQALLEFNEHRASLAIAAALSAIERRKRVLERHRHQNIHEWNLLEHATMTLSVIRARRAMPILANAPEPRIALHDDSKRAA